MSNSVMWDDLAELRHTTQQRRARNLTTQEIDMMLRNAAIEDAETVEFTAPNASLVQQFASDNNLTYQMIGGKPTITLPPAAPRSVGK